MNHPPPIRPPALRPGDAVGIISPSWGGAGHFPHRVEQGAAQLERMGYRVKFGRHALEPGDYVSASAEKRAADIHQLFADPEVRAVIAAIGGDHSCQLLPLLDYELIAANPKILVGYSDVTVLNVAIWQQTGLVTFNGPALITDFAEWPEMFPYTESNFLRVVGRPEPAGAIAPSTWWTEEHQEWESQADRERPRQRNESPGWNWLKSGSAEGPLVGGCLESLQHLRGTPYWPDLSGAILFIETSEEKPEPPTVDALLMDFENMGVFDQIAGLLVGRPMSYSDEEKAALRQVLLARTAKFNFPIISDMDFGHTAPQFTLPLGVKARIDGPKREFGIVEAAVSGGSG